MSPDRAGARAARTAGALALLMAAALLVRAVGIDFGVPVWEEPDAVIAMHVDHLRAGSTRGDRRFSDQNYPHLLARLVQPLPAPPPLEPGARLTVDEHLERAAHTHLQVRWVVAWLSLLAIPAAFLLARPFAGPGASLLAAALSATSLLCLSFSQQGRPHAAAGALLPLAVVAAMRLAARGRTRDHWLAALAAAAAVGVLQTGVFVLPPLVLAFLLRPGARGARRLLDARALIPVGLVALALACFYPFMFGLSGGALGDGAGGLDVGADRVTLAEHSLVLTDLLDGGGFRVLLLSLWNYDPVLLLAGALGLVGVALGRGRAGAGSPRPPAPEGRRAQLAVALCFALPYLAVVGMYARTYERFGTPLVPFLAALAAVGCARLVSGRAAPRVALAAAVLALALPAAACARLSWLRSRPDTLDLAAAWVAAELDRDDPVAVPPVTRMNTSFDLPLWRREDELVGPDGKRIKQHSPWTRYQLAARAEGSLPVEPGYALRWLSPRTPDENRLLARDHEAFVLSMAPGHFVIEPYEARSDHALLVDMRTTLRARGELVARFTPEGPECKIEWPFFYMLSDHFNDEGLEDWPHFVPRLFRAGAIGPAVEIYRVAR